MFPPTHAQGSGARYLEQAFYSKLRKIRKIVVRVERGVLIRKMATLGDGLIALAIEMLVTNSLPPPRVSATV